MPFWPILTDRLTPALPFAQHVDQRSAKYETEYQRSHKRPACTEGDIAEQVEHVPAVGQLGKPIEHLSPLFFGFRGGMAQFSQRVNDKRDFRAL